MVDYKSKDDYWPFIPNGTYEAQCTKYDSKFLLGKTRKLFLIFKIVDPGKYFELEIFQAFNMPYTGKIRPGSKYYKTWCMVNGWQKPGRGSKMSPKLFIGKVFKIKTRTVRPKHNGREMPENFWYSVVDEILNVSVG
jgi:hypothetical protein